MSNRIDLTQFEKDEYDDRFYRAEACIGDYTRYLYEEESDIRLSKQLNLLPKLIDELKRCYEKLDKADEAMLTAREVLMKHHEWMSMNDATSEEDDQEILDVVKALREASE